MKMAVPEEVTPEDTHLTGMVEAVQVHIIQEVDKKILQDINLGMEEW